MMCNCFNFIYVLIVFVKKLNIYLLVEFSEKRLWFDEILFIWMIYEWLYMYYV